MNFSKPHASGVLSTIASRLVANDASESVFGRVFDVVVFGAGYIGTGAVRRFLARGLSVLVVEASGQLLWESSRALENRVGVSAAGGGGGGGGREWERWVAEMAEHGAVSNGCVDTAFAEIALAREWLAAVRDGRLGVLFYALPVAVSGGKEGGFAATSNIQHRTSNIQCGMRDVAGEGEDDEQEMEVVMLATKSGVREVRARWCLDASEEGVLAARCGVWGGGGGDASGVVLWRGVAVVGMGAA
ncbi:hypothetical protein Ga0100230_019240 [Opitutaceae bacterium TAV3]|nr:hypothetical protein Ga0100230_019240 [Opitutaceae bacterium TAV3]